MVVCVCNQVTESKIRSCVEQGACTLKDVRQALGVGLGCGTCAKFARALVRQYRAEIARRESSGATAAA